MNEVGNSSFSIAKDGRRVNHQVMRSERVQVEYFTFLLDMAIFSVLFIEVYNSFSLGFSVLNRC